MQRFPVQVAHVMGTKTQIAQQVRGLLGNPETQPGGPAGAPDEGEGKDDRPVYLVQLVLDRPYKNDHEAHVLQHVLDDIEGVCGPVMALAVLVAHPLDRFQANASGEWTYTVFTLRAANESEAEDLVREAVTNTAPAPFGVAALLLTEIANDR